ncbi:MAG: hypothetical protein WB987_01400 [Candidatus Acidiferrales bacterium]
MATSSPNLIALECELLGGLCASVLSIEERGKTLRELAGYDWRSPDHRVIYEALRRSRQSDRTALREFIVAETTRLGFPDIDCTPYFTRSGVASAEIRKLVDALLASGPDAASA